MADVALARVIHVLAVVIWIGGVAMVTTVLLPAIRRGEFGEDRKAAFAALERRFSRQARIAVLLAGASGLYMLWRLSLWRRFEEPRFWWMHAMVAVWALFAFVLFLAEPLVVGRRARRADAPATETFTRLQRVHWILLCLALIAAAGAVAGSHGWSPF